jgi:hypothetical protein
MPVRINILSKRVFTKDIASGNLRNSRLFSKNILCKILIVNKLTQYVVYKIRH